MKVLNQIADGLCRAVMGISALTVFMITFAQVLCRFVFKSPLAWSTDVLRLAFTYMVFWGAVWCVKEKGHLNVDVLLASMHGGLRRGVELAIDAVLCALFCFMIVYGYQFAVNGLTQTTSYLPIPMSLYYASIPSSAVLMLFYMLQNLAERAAALGTAKERGK